MKRTQKESLVKGLRGVFEKGTRKEPVLKKGLKGVLEKNKNLKSTQRGP